MFLNADIGVLCFVRSNKAQNSITTGLRLSMRVLFIKGLLHLFALLPFRTVHGIATLLGQLVAQLPKLRMTQVTRINICMAFPHLPPTAQDALVTQSLIETCKAFSELGALWLWRVERVLGLVRRVAGEECLQQALKLGKGVILLTPHLGAWEMMGLYVSAHYTMTGWYRPPKLVGLHDFIHAARSRGGGRLVATDSAGIRALYQALRCGQIAGILPDQVPSGTGSGIFAPFFDIPAYTITIVSRLAHKTGATVIFTYAERLPHGQGFHLHFLPAAPNIAAANLEIAVSALNQGVEQCVQNCPAQYQWSYKRFKRCPDGENSVY